MILWNLNVQKKLEKVLLCVYYFAVLLLCYFEFFLQFISLYAYGSEHMVCTSSKKWILILVLPGAGKLWME